MKKIFLFISVLLVINFGYSFYQNQSDLTKKLAVQQRDINVYLKLFGQEDFIKQKIVINKTALDLTKEKANTKTKGEGENAYVTEINGITAQDSKKEYWAFYVNGKMAEVGAGSYKLKNGDRIEWKLATY